MSLRLYYIHMYNPLVIHQDVKPLNIMHCLRKYLLSDFGIAKTVDNLYTLIRTNSYIALEVW